MTNTYSLSIFARTFQGDLPSLAPPIQCASLEDAQRRTRELCADYNASGLRVIAATVATPDGREVEIGPLHPYA